MPAEGVAEASFTERGSQKSVERFRKGDGHLEMGPLLQRATDSWEPRWFHGTGAIASHLIPDKGSRLQSEARRGFHAHRPSEAFSTLWGNDSRHSIRPSWLSRVPGGGTGRPRGPLLEKRLPPAPHSGCEWENGWSADNC
jgi:hypothetical protein